MIAARISTYVQGQEITPELMTPLERDALADFVLDLFRNYGSKVFFAVDLVDGDLLLHCFQERNDGRGADVIPFPADWVNRTVVFGRRTELRLIGDRIPATLGAWDRAEIKLMQVEED
jgi:hypothetical protein